jgi:hypothetical protein
MAARRWSFAAFRFSIRDMLWFTLVVSIGLAWLVRDRQLRAELDQVGSMATKWRFGAGALEHAFVEDGWELFWKWDWDEVHITRQEESFGYDRVLSLSSHEPSESD